MSLDKANKIPIQLHKVPELEKFHSNIREDFDSSLWTLFRKVFRVIYSAYFLFLNLFQDGDLWIHLCTGCLYQLAIITLFRGEHLIIC